MARAEQGFMSIIIPPCKQANANSCFFSHVFGLFNWHVAPSRYLFQRKCNNSCIIFDSVEVWRQQSKIVDLRSVRDEVIMSRRTVIGRGTLGS